MGRRHYPELKDPLDTGALNSELRFIVDQINRGARHIIQDEGTDLPDQPRLNFVGAGVSVTDDPTDETTKVTIAGGGGGGGDDVFVNGVDVVDPNFNDTNPAAPSEDYILGKWQHVSNPSGGHVDDVSVYVPARPDIPFFGSTLLGIGNINNGNPGSISPYDDNNTAFEFPVTKGGWLRNLFVNTAGAQANNAVTSLAAVKDSVRQNHLGISIPSNAAAGVFSNIRGALRMEQSETFVLDSNLLSGSAPIALRGAVIEFAPDDGRIMIGTSPRTTVLAASTLYFPAFAGSGSGATETQFRFVVPIAGTVKDMIVRTSTAQPAGGSLVVTLRKGAVPQSVVVTIPLSSGTGIFNDLVNSFTVAQGDVITIEAVNNAPATASAVIQYVEFSILPVGKTSIIGGYGNDTFSTVEEFVAFFRNNGGSASGVRANQEVCLPRAGILRNLYFTNILGAANANPGTVTLYKNGSPTSVVVTIPGPTQAIGDIFFNTTDSVTAARGDLVTVREITTAGNFQMGVFALEFAELA